MKNPTFFIVFLLCCSFVFAQQKDHRYRKKKTIPLAAVEELDSKELNEKRVLNIYLPQGYHSDSTKTYHTIYLLDGSAHEDFPHIAGLVQFMNLQKIMPNMIVVGIQNVNRYRDFTYPSKDKRDYKNIPVHGSKKFIAFLKKEVQPFINAHYKTDKHNIIIGQSLGGLLATEIFLFHKDLFDDYIIVSPSLWWDEFRMLKGAEKQLIANNYTQKRVFLSVGKEHPVMNEVADKLAKKLQQTKGLKSYYKPDYTEDHATILHSAVYQAFKTLYQLKH